MKVFAVKADSGIGGEITKVIKKIVDDFGRLDILINNAGIFLKKAITDYTMEDYDKVMSVNARAVFELGLAAANYMAPGGRIVTIGSNLTVRVGSTGLMLYAMSKSALTGFTKGLARDLGSREITVNLVQPGPVNTDMNPKDAPNSALKTEQMAIKHYGTPEDIVDLIAYLLSPDSGYKTGSIIDIDGGTNC
jgi:3-oxoacyl-[acyl-carrier protein] reductase